MNARRTGVCVVSVLTVAALAGCAGLTGLPTPEAQLRIWEGKAAVQGGNLVTPAKGAADGNGCIVSQIGQVNAAVAYAGERCRVLAPCSGCGLEQAPAPVEDRAPPQAPQSQPGTL